jgi:cellulose synthase/poly-beta-1,6-N-acetylglucosamine synthase-like glycosyltransferase
MEWAVICSAGFLFYIACGYPLLLAMLARWRPAPLVRKSFQARSVTVILPVYNGAAFLERKLRSLLDLDYPAASLDILVLSDGSTDGTDRIAASFASRGVRLLRVPRGGKPAALNAGVAASQGEILFFTDVRQPLDRCSLRALVANFADPSVGGACGELIIEDDAGVYWRYEKWIRRQLDRVGSLMVVTGCIFAMRRELFVPVPAESLVDDAVLPIQVVLRGKRVVFEPAARAYEIDTPAVSEFRRKMRTLAGLYQLPRHVPAALAPGRLLFHLFSYKLGRLLMPYALLVLGVGSWYLPEPYRTVLCVPQAAFYGLALISPLLRGNSPLQRVSAAAASFVVLMAASLCSVVVSLVPARKLWKVAEPGASREARGKP